MRLWTLHPRHLDTKGLVALWREGLLAQSVLAGETKGYRHHPQLERFRHTPAALSCYLRVVALEARLRGYRFDASKIRGAARLVETPAIEVTSGQVQHERLHLMDKLKNRARPLRGVLPVNVSVNPVFRAVKGEIESWERMK